MSYTVLARRYRSTDFDQVVGQEPIARTLKNAIGCGRVAHAYLFTGTRGVGKTSMARILATALNAPGAMDGCPVLPGEHTYPPHDAQKRMAQAVMRGEDLNVIEIDGASNRSVEEARQLIANAHLAPTGNARFKIYIIDEVHMLTREAFNALLKTMEEPPSHVKFILCTTESHKVPTTIQSRCQRFDFRSIPTASIAAHLVHVLETEKIDADKQVAWHVARLGNGSMRDALSLLDRLIAASAATPQPDAGDTPQNQGKLTAQVLEQMLGLPDQDMVTALIDAFSNGDVAGSLQRSAQLLERGIGQDQLIDVLIEYLRQLMLIAACGSDSELVELNDDARVTATRQSQQFDAAGLVYMIALCENLQRSSKTSANPRAMFDAVIVRLALAEKMADVTALLASGRRPDKAITAQSDRPQITPAVTTEKKNDPTRSNLTTPATSNDGDDLWRRLITAIDDRPTMSWARHLALVRLDQSVVHVTPQPGHRDLIGFVNAHRRQQLAELIKPILGRPIRVELDTANMQASPPLETAGGPHPPAGHAPPQPHPTDRAAAMNLPLVQQVMAVFDVTIMNINHLRPNPSPETQTQPHSK